MSQIVSAVTNSGGQVIKAQAYWAKAGAAPARLVVQAGQKVILQVDGQTQAGSALILGKRPVLRKAGKDLSIDVDGQPVVLLVDFFVAKGATLHGDEWALIPNQGLAISPEGVTVGHGLDVAAVGVSGTGTGNKDLAAVGINGTGTGNKDLAAVGISGTNRDVAAVGISGTTRDVAAVGVSGTNMEVAAVGLSGTSLAAIAAGVSLLPLLGALGGGSEESSSSLSGSVVAGPVTGGLKLEFYKLKSGNLVLLGSTDVAEGGQWTFKIKGYTGPVVVKVLDANDSATHQGANYRSELTGQAVDLDTALLAVFNLKKGANSVNITPVTTIAAMKSGLTVDAAGDVVKSVPSDFNAQKIDASNLAVAKALSLSNILSAEVRTTLDIEGNNTFAQANAYGKLLAAIEGMGGNDHGKLEALAAMIYGAGDTSELALSGKQDLITGASRIEMSRRLLDDRFSQDGLTSSVADLLVSAKSDPNLGIDGLGDNNIITDQMRSTLQLSLSVPFETTEIFLFINGDPVDPGAAPAVRDAISGQWTVDLSGLSWSYGAHELTVQTLVGSEKGISASQLFSVVDTLAGAAPTLALRWDSGPAVDGITQLGIMNVSGLEPGATWQYSTDNGVVWLTGTGNSFELAPGNYAAGAVQARQTDQAGNTSLVAQTERALVVDVSASAPALNLLDDSGVAGDGITRDGGLGVTGLEAGGKWEYSTDSGQTWQPGTGTAFVLDTGTYVQGSLQVRQTDAAGNLSAAGVSAMTILVDFSPSEAPSLSLAIDTGSAASDGITNIGLINVGGLVAGDAWQYSTDNGQSWLAGSGSGFVLNEGSYAPGHVQVRQTDVAGNVSPVGSNASAIVVQTSVAPTISLALLSDTGTSSADGITKTGTITVGGLQEGATWEYSLDAGLNWTTGSGASFELSHGTYTAGSVQVRQTTLAGNTSAPGYNMSAFQVDTQSPDTALTLSLNVDSGRVSNDGISNVGAITVAGLESGASWSYSTDAGVTWATGGGSGFTLSPGQYAAGAVLVRQTDLAGNTSAASAGMAYRVITGPLSNTVTVTRLRDNVGVVQGFVANQGRTDDTGLVVEGSLGQALSVGDVVKVYDGALYLGNATVNPTTRSWTFSDSRSLVDGQVVAFSAVIEDIAGNFSSSSSSYVATVDQKLSTTIDVTGNDASGASGIASDAGASDAFSGLDTVAGGVGNDVITVSDLASSTLEVQGLGGNDLIQFVGTNTGSFTVDGGAGNDTINLSRLTTGQLSLLLGDGDDRVGAAAMTSGISVWDGAGADSMVLGGGNDTVYASAFVRPDNDTTTTGSWNDTFTGGLGVDVLSYEGHEAAVTVNINANSSGGGRTGRAFKVDLSNEYDFFNGFEKIVGGSGNDRFFVSNLISLGGLSVEGGAGTDEFRYTSATTAGLVVSITASPEGIDGLSGTAASSAGTDSFSGIERIYTGAGDDSFFIAAATNVTLNGGAGNDTLTLSALSKTASGGGLGSTMLWSVFDWAGDVVHLQGFWDAGVVNANNLGSYVRMNITTNPDNPGKLNYNLQVDIDGSGTSSPGWKTVAGLSAGVENFTTLDALYTSGHLIISG